MNGKRGAIASGRGRGSLRKGVLRSGEGRFPRHRGPGECTDMAWLAIVLPASGL